MIKVCLAGTYPAGTAEQFRAALDPAAFSVFTAASQEEFDAVTDADVIVLRILKMPATAFQRFTGLKMVMRWGVGYDSVDIEEAGRRNVLVCNTPGANAYAVAELAVGMMIDIGRHVTAHTGNTRRGIWDREFFKPSLTLNGKTVGIVGGGNIGRQVATRVQAFGASTVYYDVFRLPEEAEKSLGMEYLPLDDLLTRADVVTVHVPLLDSTRHIIGREQIARMKKTAILINTARGGLVDDAALLEALQEKKLLGAGLDCVEDEASPVTAALLTLDNAVITPHIGGTSGDLGTAIIPMILDDLKRLEAGEQVRYIVNSQYLQA